MNKSHQLGPIRLQGPPVISKCNKHDNQLLLKEIYYIIQTIVCLYTYQYYENMTGLCLFNMRVRLPIPLSFSLAISKEHQRRRKVIYGTAQGLPEVRNQTDILYVFQDDSVKFPQAWTGGNDVRDRDRDLDPAVI